KGFEVWYDQRIKPGTRWNDELAQAIEDCAAFLFFASENSVTSEVCLDEINFALERQKPLQVVMIEEIRLPPGLELRLGTRQHILKSERGQASYEEMLVRALGAHQFHVSKETKERLPAEKLGKWPQRILMPVAILLLLAVIGFLVSENSLFDRNPDVAKTQSIAVLPLEDLSRDGDLEYLADGISEELINGLSKVEGLNITSRSKAFRYRDSELDVQEIGDALGVDAILEGSVRSAGDQIRISIALVDVETGFQLWSQTYTRQSGSLFEIQDDITKKVVDALSIQLGDQSGQAQMYGTANVEAYDNYLNGIYLKDGSLQDLKQSVGYLRTAIDLDPDFARPYGELATQPSLQHDLFVVEKTPALIEEAKELLATAETLDTTGDPYITVNARWHLSLRERDWAGAEDIINRAMHFRASGAYEQNPLLEELPLERMYADLLGAAGLYNDSNSYYLRAQDQFEIDQTTLWGLAQNYMALGDYPAAIKTIDNALEKWPQLEYQVLLKGKVYALAGDWDNAEAILDQLIDSGAYQSAQYLQILTTIKQGDATYATQMLAEEAELDNYPSDLYLISGDLENGFSYTNYYLDLEGPTSAQIWILNRFFDGYMPASIKQDARYSALMKNLNLTEAWQGDLCRRAATLAPTTGIVPSCS
ncbi:MAG: TIR domain-containing protein, partial [Gammaproteobacteria bacterium]|nr:TIR domain-containing protein [Gammaproteobacteria bacterium]